MLRVSVKIPMTPSPMEKAGDEVVKKDIFGDALNIYSKHGCSIRQLE